VLAPQGAEPAISPKKREPLTRGLKILVSAVQFRPRTQQISLKQGLQRVPGVPRMPGKCRRLLHMRYTRCRSVWVSSEPRAGTVRAVRRRANAGRAPAIQRACARRPVQPSASRRGPSRRSSRRTDEILRRSRRATWDRLSIGQYYPSHVCPSHWDRIGRRQSPASKDGRDLRVSPIATGAVADVLARGKGFVLAVRAMLGARDALLCVAVGGSVRPRLPRTARGGVLNPWAMGDGCLRRGLKSPD
jgi:hypothetical protein